MFLNNPLEKDCWTILRLTNATSGFQPRFIQKRNYAS
nr:MAG TPA: hypothetical protein [Caudoviricetes sp.]